jgi:hypothetical protein
VGDMLAALAPKADAQKTAEATQASSEKAATATAATADALTKPHTAYFKFSDEFLRGKYAKTVKESVLDALRIALFEFFMYMYLSPADIADAMQKGAVDPTTFGKSIVEQARVAGGKYGEAYGAAPKAEEEEGKDPKDKTPTAATAPARAAGGLVTGINGGMAVVRPAPGEGLTSIGAGETILPANARGGLGAGAGGSVKVELSLKGDLARIIEAKASDVVYESKRRERFTG